MSRLLHPGVLAIVAIIAAVLLASADSGYAWVPIAAWVAYQLITLAYAMGRDQERFDREHPRKPPN